MYINLVFSCRVTYTSELEDCQLEEPPSKRIATGSELIERSSVWGCFTEILTESGTDAAEERERECDNLVVL